MEKREHLNIKIRGAAENNLKSINVEIPLQQMVVVTGVSGSGKSSLAFDVIAREGQRRYLESMPSFLRQFSGKFMHPDVESIENLPPVISLSQKAVGGGARSTVGTMSDMYDMLRLLFARLGKTDESIKLSRSLFSFNTPIGACKHCSGLGLEEKISLQKLITEPEKTLREGALSPTLPTGYIVYSQVTMDSLNMLCEAHGFNVDIPWNQLTAEQQDIILYGSTKIKIPIGKHSLESRLKWEGIAAKPREEDYYKGIVTIMTDILRRDRNKNILRYVESVPCSVCSGKRLNQKALSVYLHDKNIAELSEMELVDLKSWFRNQKWSDKEINVVNPVSDKLCSQIDMLTNLGMGHMSLARPTDSLSGGETQRIRLVNQISAELSDVLYIFDEAFVGLHPKDHQYLLDVFRQLVNNGNTVILVEHDELAIRQADFIVDIGPGAGNLGGELLFAGTLDDFLNDKNLVGKSPTQSVLLSVNKIDNVQIDKCNKEYIYLKNATKNNLKNINIRFLKSALNVVSGLSGAGKSSLIHGELEPLMKSYFDDNLKNSDRLSGVEGINNLISISNKPIGRTPRSNPATYTGLANALRDLFSKQESAIIAGYKKSHFSFNTKGGRCETCLGAGRIQVGMHFLGNVDIPCPECNGKRFKSEILDIKYHGLSISEVLELTVSQASEFFKEEKKILLYLDSLLSVGLGYIKLGQPSTTLSGGEAQRIKLATHLRNQAKGKTLYILNEPGNGLHAKDVEKLLSSLKNLTAKGHTLICIAQSEQFVNSADWLVEIGPGRGKSGGKLMFEGSPALLSEKNGALSYSVLNKNFISNESHDIAVKFHKNISLRGVRTHNLKCVDVDIPKRKMTVLTGVSGSGKSSLVFDTLAAEATSRFNESMSAYSRSFLKQSNFAKLDFSSGLSPVLAISPTHKAGSLRSTVGTVTGLYDYYRLLFSRIGQCRGYEYTAQNFSFNHQSGACPHCNGLGVELVCNPEALIAKPELSVLNGVLCGSAPGKYFGNPDGQFVAILKQAAKEMNLDVDKAYQDLDEESKNLVLYGSGEKVYELDWEFKTKTRTGIQHLSANWPGFCYYIEDEYRRKHTNKTSDKLQALMHEKPCSVCKGGRLKQELLEIELVGKNIVELSKLPISDALIFLENLISEDMSEIEMAVITEIVPRVTDLLHVLESLGLSYITTARSSLSLSGGEMQRVRLAGAFASRLYGVCYVLDEPGMGLHRKDIPALINILKTLVKQGNTVVVLEHDEQFIRAADNIIEMGPAAGINGGEIIASGSLNDIMATDTPTGRYLSKSVLPKPVAHQIVEKSFGVIGARANNLKSIDVDFIRGGLVAVTGVSGSGKSSLLRDVLLASINSGKSVNCDSIYGVEKFDNILSVNQNSISANSLSTILTFTGLMDVVRDCFAKTDDASVMGLKKTAFSYINKEGKCPVCGGMGVQKNSMDFMSDVNLPCEYCNGTRYRPEVLLCNYKGRNIGEVLDFSVSEAAEFFADNQKLSSSFQLMNELGLGHVKIGQAGNTLSGGESQRLKLAAELIRSKKGKNLFLFDEPSAGLHHQDILALLKVFHRLADLGHTLVYVEHRSEMIAAANQKICLGPGAGDNGGALM